MALDVRRSTSTAEIYAEISLVPIIYCTNIRLLSQLLRLHGTLSGRQLLDKVSGRTGSQAARHLSDLKEELVDLKLFADVSLAPMATMAAGPAARRDSIPGMPRKSLIAGCVGRMYAKCYLKHNYPGH